MAQGSQASRRQIIGMNVIGIDIIAVDQRGQAFLQAFQRQAIGSINPGCPQDAHRHSIARPPVAQLALGVDPPFGPRIVRSQRSRLVDPASLTIAINPCRTYVNQAPW